MLTREEQRELLAIARDAIAHALRHEPAATGAGSGSLGLPGGAFVTLRRDRELRGCIGYIESALPLAQVVAEVAVKAACSDPRFPPVTIGDLDGLTVEVSVLSPLHRVVDVNEVRIGEHGLLLEVGWNRGLLLPQVAVEYGWDREQFLEHTARKAGLPPRAWEDPHSKLYIFSAEVFDEDCVR
jgi:hypothetical protein